jgi:hypothetical protein
MMVGFTGLVTSPLRDHDSTWWRWCRSWRLEMSCWCLFRRGLTWLDDTSTERRIVGLSWLSVSFSHSTTHQNIIDFKSAWQGRTVIGWDDGKWKNGDEVMLIWDQEVVGAGVTSKLLKVGTCWGHLQKWATIRVTRIWWCVCGCLLILWVVTDRYCVFGGFFLSWKYSWEKKFGDHSLIGYNTLT